MTIILLPSFSRVVKGKIKKKSKVDMYSVDLPKRKAGFIVF